MCLVKIHSSGGSVGGDQHCGLLQQWSTELNEVAVPGSCIDSTVIGKHLPHAVIAILSQQGILDPATLVDGVAEDDSAFSGDVAQQLQEGRPLVVEHLVPAAFLGVGPTAVHQHFIPAVQKKR